MLRPYIISLRAPTTIPQVRISRPCHTRQPQRKRAAFAHRTIHLAPPSLQFREQPRDREAKPGSSQLAAARLIDPKEPIEDPIYMLWRDPGPGIAHANSDLGTVLRDHERHAAARRVAHGVGRE